jgi:hypothetical protein
LKEIDGICCGSADDNPIPGRFDRRPKPVPNAPVPRLQKRALLPRALRVAAVDVDAPGGVHVLRRPDEDVVGPDGDGTAKPNLAGRLGMNRSAREEEAQRETPEQKTRHDGDRELGRRHEWRGQAA